MAIPRQALKGQGPVPTEILDPAVQAQGKVRRTKCDSNKQTPGPGLDNTPGNLRTAPTLKHFSDWAALSAARSTPIPPRTWGREAVGCTRLGGRE